jgi:hypothetical protein
MVRLLNSFIYSPDNYANPSLLGFNKTFQDYEDLVQELNKATLIDPNQATLTPQFFIPGDITFSYDSNLNRIRVKGNNYETNDPVPVPQFYYLPVGFGDPNLQLFINSIPLTANSFPTNGGYTLNRRLGYLWNGIFEPNPPFGSGSYANLVNHTFPKPASVSGGVPSIYIYYTAEGYADLVNSANLFLFCDIIGGSTQDNVIDGLLLGVVPMNTANLGVAFSESKVSCPLTKISENIFQIRFTMRTDTGEPFWLPTNAYVNVELKIEY